MACELRCVVPAKFSTVMPWPIDHTLNAARRLARHEQLGRQPGQLLPRQDHVPTEPADDAEERERQPGRHMGDARCSPCPVRPSRPSVDGAR